MHFATKIYENDHHHLLITVFETEVHNSRRIYLSPQSVRANQKYRNLGVHSVVFYLLAEDGYGCFGGEKLINCFHYSLKLSVEQFDFVVLTHSLTFVK